MLAAGDVNLTFKRYIERPVTLTIANDYVTDIGYILSAITITLPP